MWFGKHLTEITNSFVALFSYNSEEFLYLQLGIQSVIYWMLTISKLVENQETNRDDFWMAKINVSSSAIKFIILTYLKKLLKTKYYLPLFQMKQFLWL